MSHTNQPKAGDLVYDERGGEYQYVAKHPDGRGHIVLIWYDSDDGPSDYCGEPALLQTVFFGEGGLNSVHQKTDAQLAVLLEKIAAARAELKSIEQAQRDADRETVERRERLKQHDKLKLLDDYLAGKITHFVVRGHGSSDIRVLTTTQATTRKSNYGRTETRLLSLYGESQGDLQWKINYYSDGSGGSEYADPFTNEEDAIAFARSLISSGIIGALNGNKNGNGYPYEIDGWIDTADRFNVFVDGKVRALKTENDAMRAATTLEKAKASLAAAQAAVDALARVT